MAFLWTEVARSPKAVQVAFFNEIVEKERIYSFNEIRKGDHLIYKTSFLFIDSYFHHCLCIGHSENGNPIVIHYFGTSAMALSATGRTSGKHFGAKVQRMQLPNEESLKDEADLVKKETQRVIWSPDIRRYSVEETIERAIRRERDSYFDLVKNNCEHFVMWCMCDINISLQVTDIHFPLREAFLAVKNGVLHTFKTQLPKIATEWVMSVIDDAAAAAAKVVAKGGARGLTKVSIGLSAGFGLLVEALVTGYEIYQKNKQNKDGVLSKEEYITSISEIVTAGVSRFGFGLAGAVIGQICIPVPFLGALIGSFIGAGLGNIIGNFIGHYIGEGYLWITEKVKNLFS